MTKLDLLSGLFVLIGVIEIMFIAFELDFCDKYKHLSTIKAVCLFIADFFKNRNVFGYFLSLLAIVLLSPGLLILLVFGTLFELVICGLSALWKAGDKK